MPDKFRTVFAASILTLISSPAFASFGSVKVDCGDSCFDVVVGAVCDAYVQHSRPVAIACDDTATPGFGRKHVCGKNGITCTSYGTLLQSDPVGAYCKPGPGNDAIVTCVSGSIDPMADEGSEDPEEDTEPGAEDKVESDATPPAADSEPAN